MGLLAALTAGKSAPISPISLEVRTRPLMRLIAGV